MSIPAIIRSMRAAGVAESTIVDAIYAMEEERLAKGRARTAKCRNNNKKSDVARVTNVTRVTSPLPDKKVSPTPPSKNYSTPESPNGDSTAHEPFDEFWEAYPKREGDNPKKPAKASFERALRKGADPQLIISAAKALRAKHPTPSPYVPQAVTWLNQERWDDMFATGPPEENIVKFRKAEDVVREVMEQKRAAGSGTVSGA